MDKTTNKKTNRGGGFRRRSSFKRPKPEFEQKIISIRRVTRVVAGGRRFSFSVSLLAGDKKGRIGLGLGKAGDTFTAINKALRDAKKNMVKLNLTQDMSIPFEVKAKYASSRVLLVPNKGRGLVAGTVIRDIINLSGMKGITGKVVSKSKSKMNNAKAVIKALSQISKEDVGIKGVEEKKDKIKNTDKKVESEEKQAKKKEVESATK